MNPTKAGDFPTQVSSWGQLTALVEHFSFFAGHAWLFRGVSDASHRLLPKIGRLGLRKRKYGPAGWKHVPYRREDERAVFTMFKQQARAYLPVPPATDLEWLVLAQHFGLPTRLLDWTDGLLVAAWFAVEKAGAKAVDSAIWVTKQVPVLPSDFVGDPLTLPQPHTVRPPHISPRISAQGSVFVLCPIPTAEPNLPFTKKITIARGSEFNLKKRLHACGINRRHLFPDLAGLSDHLGWIYKNDWLAGYRGTATAMVDDSPDADQPPPAAPRRRHKESASKPARKRAARSRPARG